MGSEKNNRARQLRRPMDPGVQTIPPFDKRARLSIAASLLGVTVTQLLREHFENPRERLIAQIGGEMTDDECLRIVEALQEGHPVIQTVTVSTDPACARCNGTYPIRTAAHHLVLCYIPEDSNRLLLCQSCINALEQSGKIVRVYWT